MEETFLTPEQQNLLNKIKNEKERIQQKARFYREYMSNKKPA